MQRGASKRVKSFTIEEDRLLIQLVALYGQGHWAEIGKRLNRTARQCRDRYTTYLNPYVYDRPWIPAEDELLKKLVRIYHHRWRKISLCFEGRSSNCVKNRWLKKLANEVEDTGPQDSDTRRRGTNEDQEIIDDYSSQYGVTSTSSESTDQEDHK